MVLLACQLPLSLLTSFSTLNLDLYRRLSIHSLQGNEDWISRGPIFIGCAPFSLSIVRANSAKVLRLNLQWVRPFRCIQQRIAVGFTAPPGTKSKLDLDARNFGLWAAFWFGRKSFSPGLCFVILLRVVLGLFAMQHVLCTDTSIKVACHKRH